MIFANAGPLNLARIELYIAISEKKNIRFGNKEDKKNIEKTISLLIWEYQRSRFPLILEILEKVIELISNDASLQIIPSIEILFSLLNETPDHYLLLVTTRKLIYILPIHLKSIELLNNMDGPSIKHLDKARTKMIKYISRELYGWF